MNSEQNNSKFKIQNLTFKRETAVSLLRDSWPLILSALIVSIYMKIDQVMIKEMLDTQEVGYYSAAVRLSEAWFAIGVIVCNSLFPAIINAKKETEAFYYKRIQNLFLFLIMIAYVLSIFVYFLSNLIILLLYGKEYINASAVLSIHMFSAIFVYLGVSSGRWLIIENKSIINLYRTSFGLVVNIILNYFLIKKHGIVGAAYASLVAYIVAYYLADTLFPSTRKIFVLKTYALLLRKIK